ncbi:MAG: hypothetical protein AB7P04_02945 [Bacteriovoracia bacterium]
MRTQAIFVSFVVSVALSNSPVLAAEKKKKERSAPKPTTIITFTPPPEDPPLAVSSGSGVPLAPETGGGATAGAPSSPAITPAVLPTAIPTTPAPNPEPPITSAYASPNPRAKSFNPDVSANFLGGYRHSTRGNDVVTDDSNGFYFQEAELQFTADVDPYFRGVGLFSLHRENGAYAFEPEEVYFETLAVPTVTIKGGKFKAFIGRQNTLHSHAYPFVDAPLANQNILGDEGMNDVGLSGAVLIPASWFMEFTLQVMSGQEADLYKSAHPNDLVTVAHFKNLWDLSAATTMELGLSGATGWNQWDGRSNVYGADLTFKFRPTEGGKYRSLSWSTEYLAQAAQNNPNGSGLGGLATWLQYQFAERWWVQGRYDFLGLPVSDAFGIKNKQSLLLGFFPSEFSALRAQYDHLADDAGPDEHRMTLQYNISIGAHPAHAY